MLTFRYATADRFLPPRLIQPVAVADQPAPQNPDALDALWGTRLAPGNEDCLRVHVWVPVRQTRGAGSGTQPSRAAGAKGIPTALPVLVYVHGGAFLIGSGRWGWHDGADLANSLGCIVVSFNYRLGCFGFLDLSAFGDEFTDSGNLGLLDQLAALRWVKERIADFGGDAQNITILGQSAGAMSVACLLGSPLTTGLFRRAVCLSGGPTLVRSPESARQATQFMMKRTGCTTPDELRSRSMDELLAAQKWTMTQSDFGAPKFCPTVGGTVLPTYPLDTLNRSVRLLLGHTRDEMRLWKLYVPQLGGLPPEALRPWLRRLVGDRADDLIRSYRQAMPGATGGNISLAVVGDVVFRLPVLRMAEAHGSARVFRLEYTPAVPGDLGAPHALDAALLFGNFAAPGIRRLVGSTPEAARDRLRELVGAFLRDADEMPVYEARRQTMLVGETVTIADDPAGGERAAWDGVPFDGRRPAPDDLPRKRELLLFVLRRLARRWLPWLVALVLLAVGWYFSG